MARKNDSDDEDITTPPPDPWSVLARLANALENIAANQQANPNQDTAGLMVTLTQALTRLSETQLEGSKLIADETRRAHRPSNEVTPGISVFNRRGDLLEDYKKPKLKCIMMIPWLVEWESCTREEVELLNLLEAGEYAVKRTDNSKVRVTVVMDYKVDGKTPHRLLLNHETAFNNDNKNLVPILSDMLRQILRQHDRPVALAGAAVMTDEEEEALIEAGELTVSQ